MNRSSSRVMCTQNQTHTQQLTELHDKVVSSNSELERLVKDIHVAVTQNSVQNLPGSTMVHEYPTSFQPMAQMAACKVTSHDIKPYIAAVAPTPAVSLPVRALAKEVPHPHLPPSIMSLNMRRQENAMEVVAKREEISRKLPPERPACFKSQEPTIDELAHGLDYIFSNNGKSHLGLLKDIHAWVQLLRTLVDSRILSLTSPEALQHTDLLELFIHLNDKLETTGDNMRQSFYQASTAVHVDDILQRIVTLTRSIRVEQVVDEFIDIRQEWTEDQQ